MRGRAPGARMALGASIGSRCDILRPIRPALIGCPTWPARATLSASATAATVAGPPRRALGRGTRF